MTEIENQLGSDSGTGAARGATDTAEAHEDPAVVVSAGRERVVALARLRDMALVPPLILILAIGYVSEGSVFLSSKTQLNVLQQQSEIALIVLAEAMILIAGKFDLSLESILGLAPGVAAWLVLPEGLPHGLGVELPAWTAIPIALGVGLAIGAFNALLIVRFGLSAFIVTLGMLITLRGVLEGISKGQTFFQLPDSMTYLGQATWVGLPASVWISLLAFAAGMVALGYYRHGRALYAIGGNEAAAKAAGIRTDRVLWGVYMIGGMLAALAGILLAGRLASVGASFGEGEIFTVFAAAVIGGVSLNGGKGTIFGAFTGVLLLFEIQTLLTYMGVPSEWLKALNGLIILLALMLARIASGRTQN